MIFNLCHLQQLNFFIWYFRYDNNVMNFNVFHYLLYTKYMNTWSKERWLKWYVCEGGRLYSRDIHHSLEDEEKTPQWNLKTPQVLCTQGSVLLYKHCSYTMLNTHVAQVLKKTKTKHTREANFFHSFLKHVCLQCRFVKAVWMWVHSLWASVFRSCCNSAPRDVFLCLYQGSEWNP